MSSTFLLLALALLLPQTTFAITCSHGVESHPASEAESTAGNIPVGYPVCPEDSFVGINNDVGQAKQQLNTMWCGGRAASCGPYTSSVQELDPKFAVCAARFLSAVRQRDASICIESAYRSSPHQACVCSIATGPCASPGKSKHQLGLAIDIEKKGSNTLPSWVHQMAQQGGGISFPVNNDDGHMQPASTSGDCSTPGYVAPDSALTPQQAMTPTQQLMSNLRQMFAPQKPQQQSAPPTSVPASAQPSGAFSTPSPSPITTPSSNVTSTTTSSTLGDTSESSPTAVSDLLSALSDSAPSTATTSATGTSIALIRSLADTSTIAPETDRHIPLATNTYTLSPNQPASTFTSEDLANTSHQAYAPTGKTTFALEILESLKQSLLTVVEYLRPFRGVGRDALVTRAVME